MNSATEGNRDDEIMAQKEAIEAEIRKENPLISDREDFALLERVYENDEAYLSKVRLLKDTYECIRRVRPDGNCFFRAVGFAYLEQLLNDKSGKLVKFMDKIRPTKEEMIKMGFPQFTMEDFFDTFMDTLETLQKDTSDLNTLLQTFNDDGMSNYLIVFMRLLTSLNIKAQHEFYQNFLEGGQTVGILLQRGGTDVQGVRPYPHNRLLPTVWGQCPGDVPRQGLKQRGSAPRFP